MRNAPLKIASVAGMTVVICLLVPLALVAGLLYAIQGPDPDEDRSRQR